MAALTEKEEEEEECFQQVIFWPISQPRKTA